MSPSAVPPIGERIRHERMRKGVSARGLAREIGVSASLISQIETDKSQPSVSTLYAITTALGISVEDIFAPVDGVGGSVADSVGDGVEPGAGLAVPPAEVAVPPAEVAVSPSEVAAPPGDVVPDQAPTSVPETISALRMLGSTRRRVGPVVRAAEREVLTLDSGVTWELLGQVPDAHTDFLRITYQPGGSSSSGAGLLMRHSGTEYGHVLSGELVLTLGFEEHHLRAGDSVSFDSTMPHSYRNDGTEPAVGIWFVLERSA
ncbi:XRE family transcriptional regulator [Jiangella ureilytica]|uniref:XRE family transcriptional regulator n=1 Tax=Jiangella ureilytica TaxID=2530374 RepID=A0A4R4RJ75_9ACTN|nr:XRE family transcriptional regulator [Jiangella ureilytica]TDC49404.1 XRE family transcriptional regulator [Jiangella ureilytica]